MIVSFASSSIETGKTRCHELCTGRFRCGDRSRSRPCPACRRVWSTQRMDSEVGAIIASVAILSGRRRRTCRSNRTRSIHAALHARRHHPRRGPIDTRAYRNARDRQPRRKNPKLTGSRETSVNSVRNRGGTFLTLTMTEQTDPEFA